MEVAGEREKNQKEEHHGIADRGGCAYPHRQAARRVQRPVGHRPGRNAISAALARAGVTGDQIDYVIMGQVLQAGVGQIPARQAAVKGGVPMSVPALTVNKVCLSGLNAIALADQLIRAGECELVVAGGMESMTQAPHLLPGARAGIKFGNATLVDSMAFDGLWDVFTDQAMGALTEHANHGAQAVTREDQDAFAVRSHLRAQAATDAGCWPRRSHRW